MTDDTEDTPTPIQEPRLWSDERWTARVIKNEDDDGWAVSMTLHGEAEPALVGPWTMGRDKKNPKPLDASAFHTLVKTASEVLRRHEQQLHAQLNKNVTIDPRKAAISRLISSTVRLSAEAMASNPEACTGTVKLERFIASNFVPSFPKTLQAATSTAFPSGVVSRRVRSTVT